MNPRDSKIDFFNEHAEQWDTISEAPPPERLRAIVALGNCGPGARVLDVGCGTGVLVPALLEAVGVNGSIVAIDPAAQMLEVLRQKHPDRRIETRCEMLETCALADGSFDTVLCFSCFPHVSEKPRAIANAARLLKTGGNFVIAHVSSREEINAFHAHCSEPVCRDLLPDEAALRNMVAAAGLEMVAFADEPGRYEAVAEKKRP